MRPTLAAVLLPAAVLVATSVPLYAQDTPPPPPIDPLKPFQLPRSETYALPNGMKVTLLPYGTTPKVTVDLRVFAGTLNETGAPWAAQMTAEMLKEGAGGLTSDQIADRAADMGGRISVGAGAQMTSVSTDVLSEKAA
ncbi:MAG: insulinase family protein, partial [Pseudomonadota bacterium]|nr:insulinase family protein [Pseudomonadota bacterium]